MIWNVRIYGRFFDAKPAQTTIAADCNCNQFPSCAGASFKEREIVGTCSDKQ